MNVIRDEVVVARKDHRCMSGLNVIKKGWTYNRTTIVYDDCIYTWKQCMMCKEAMAKAHDRDYLYPEERFPEGWAREDNVGCGEVS